MRLLLLTALCAFASAPDAAAQGCDGADRVADVAPTYYALAAPDPGAAAVLGDYACALVHPDSDIAELLVRRDSVVARLGPLVETWEERIGAAAPDWNAAFEALYAEAAALALRPITAEGMVLGLTVSAFPDAVTARARPDLALHLAALAAIGGTQGGEYPYLDLDAEVDLVRAAEALRARYPASPYLAETQADFGRALLTLASLHVVDGDESGTWYAGVGTGEFWPWAGDRNALERFVAEAPGSRYHAPLAAILADPPLAAFQGDIEFLAVAREPTLASAEARALAWLDQGVDVVGTWFDGRDAHVVFRYAPAGHASLDRHAARAAQLGLTAERVRLSVDDLWGK